MKYGVISENTLRLTPVSIDDDMVFDTLKDAFECAYLCSVQDDCEQVSIVSVKVKKGNGWQVYYEHEGQYTIYNHGRGGEL